jgi:hypothetical protein
LFEVVWPNRETAAMNGIEARRMCTPLACRV